MGQKERKIAWDNRAFFGNTLPGELQGAAFESAVYRALHRPATCRIERAGCEAVLTIDAVDLRDEPFLKDFSKVMDHVAAEVPFSVYGRLNDRAVVETPDYRVELCVSRYWPHGVPSDAVEDPTQLPSCVAYGRQIDVKIMHAA